MGTIRQPIMVMITVAVVWTVVGESASTAESAAVDRLRRGQLSINSIIDELNASAKDPRDKAELLDLLDGVSRNLPIEDQVQVYRAALSLAANADPRLVPLRLNAIRTASYTAPSLARQNGVPQPEITEFAQRMVKLASDRGEDPEIRGMAVKAISRLKYKEAIPELLGLLDDKDNTDNTPVARALCVALFKLDAKEAVRAISHLAATTTDEYVFASATLALGQLGGEEALRALVGNQGRFDATYCGAGLRTLRPLIREVLTSQENPLLWHAIEATKYFYKSEDIAEQKALLKAILFSTTDAKVIRHILERLRQIVTREEAKEIIAAIPPDPQCNNEWTFYRELARFVPIRLVPKDSGSILDPRRRVLAPSIASERPLSDESASDDYWTCNRLTPQTSGNEYGQEVGDAVYRDRDGRIYNLDLWKGQAGVFVGFQSGELSVIEARKGTGNSGGGLGRHPLTDMTNDENYWGAYTTTLYAHLPFEMRRAIANMAATGMFGNSYDYDENDLIVLENTGTDKIEPQDIAEIRSDGVVEYAYEHAGVLVWGKNDANHDVTDPANLSAHNDLYDCDRVSHPLNPDLYEPDKELLPVVQCGRAGGFSTYLTDIAYTDFPVSEMSYSVEQMENSDNYKVIVTVKATDASSGIRFISAYIPGANFPNEGSEVKYGSAPSTPQQTQHFTFENVTPSQDYYIYTSAMDWAGNYIMYEPVRLYLENVITVTAPSEEFPIIWRDPGSRDPTPIRWTYTGIPMTEVELQYRLYSGAWTPIATVPVDDGEYYWTIPPHPTFELPQTKCTIRVCAAGDWPDQHGPLCGMSVPFAILDCPVLTVDSPSGGEEWRAQSFQTIRWTVTLPAGDETNDPIDEVMIARGGGIPIVIAESTENDGEYIWEVPAATEHSYSMAVFAVSGPVCVNPGCVDMDNTCFCGVSAGSFHVTPAPTIDVTSPASLERLVGGTQYEIQWQSSENLGSVQIEYMTAGKSIIITPSTTDNGSFLWDVPDDPGEYYRVRVSELPEAGTVSGYSPAFFAIDATPHVITLTKPSAEDYWTEDETRTIKWTWSGAVGAVRIERSHDGGTSWRLITASTPVETGSYSWTVVGGINSDNVIIRISETNGLGYDESDVFSISEIRTIDVQSPGGTGEWDIGTTHDIEWTWTGLIPAVSIEFTTNGSVYYPIVLDHQNPDDGMGTYAWTLPNHPAFASPPCQVQVRVQEAGDVLSGLSDPFSVCAPRSLEITSPNGGEVLLIGSTYDITWNSEGCIDYVDILYSTDAGETWETIAAHLPNASPLPWTVPFANSYDCLLRIFSSDERVVSDVSDGLFQIRLLVHAGIGVESKTVYADAVDRSVGIYIYNDEEMGGMTLPLEFRAVPTAPPAAGKPSSVQEAFIAGSFNVLAGGRMLSSDVFEFAQLDLYSQPDGSECSGPISHTFTTPGATSEFYTSPSAILIRIPPQPYPCLETGSDGEPGYGDPSFILQFDTDTIPGVFEIDTCCIGPGEHFQIWGCPPGAPQSWTFTKGVITVVDPVMYRCGRDVESDAFLDNFESTNFGGWDFVFSTDGVQSGTNPVGAWSTAFDPTALSGSYSVRLYATAQDDPYPYRVDAAISDTFPFVPDLTAMVHFDSIQGSGGTGISFFQIAVLSAEDTTQRVTYGFSTTGDVGGMIKQTVSPGDEIVFTRNIESDFVQETGLPLVGDVIVRFLARADYAEDGTGARVTDVRIDDIVISGDGWGDLCDNCPYVYNPEQKDTDGDGIGDVCECVCPYQGDGEPDGFLTAIDLAMCIDILFAGQVDTQDRNCPSPRMDFDCDGFSTAIDLALLIDHLFAGAAGPCDPCGP